MEPQKLQEAWPVIGHSDVADFCRQICTTIVELEQAFEARDLPKRLTSGRFEQCLGPRLFESYEKLAKVAHAPRHHLRRDAVHALLAQLENDLAPTQVATATLLVPPEGAQLDTEVGSDHRGTDPLKYFKASIGGRAGTMLRLDQMLDARFWRIGFAFETLGLSNEFAQRVVRSATNRLASDLLGLQRILERFNPASLEGELKIVPYPKDKRFEHLILDILNEDARRAFLAPLLEDFLEKTDLRVKYPELKRRRGGRVQITSVILPEHHKAKLDAIRLAEEFVFLSPLSIAQFVNSLHGALGDTISGTSPLSLVALSQCINVELTDAPRLAAELRRMMYNALTQMPNSPIGPLIAVPLPIRQLIRLFVETQTMASTNTLRKREKTSRRNSTTRGETTEHD